MSMNMYNRIAFDVGDTWARVVDGTKTVTRRLWPHTVGRVLYATVKGECVGEVRITSCTKVLLSDTTQAEVELEGFPGKSREWFIDLLAVMYGDRLHRENLYRIGFTLVSVVPDPQRTLPGLE